MPQFGLTPLSTTSLGTNQFPVSAAFVPGTANGDLTSFEGILINTDGGGFKSTAVRMGLKDGDNVTLGLTTQTKATDGSATSWSVIQLLKGTLDKLLNGNVPVSGTFWQATQPVSGTFWQATQPVSGTVTANAGTNLNTSALALDTSVNGVLVAQGSTTSGQKGPVIQGAVTSSAPSYTTAQTSPFSLTTAGALRIDGSGATQPVSGTFWQATQPISGTVTANTSVTGTPSVIVKPVKALSITAGTPQAVWTPAGGKKFRLFGGYLAGINAAESIMLEDGTGNEFMRIPTQQGNSSYIPFNLLPTGYLSSAANNALYLDVTATTAGISGYVYGYEE